MTIIDSFTDVIICTVVNKYIVLHSPWVIRRFEKTVLIITTEKIKNLKIV